MFVGNGFPAVMLLVLIGVATLFALLAMILGLAAIIRINNSKGELHGRGMAACALVLGLLWMMGLPLLFFVAGAAPATINSRVIAPAPVPLTTSPLPVAPPRVSGPRASRPSLSGPSLSGPSVSAPSAANTDVEKDTDVIEPVERGMVPAVPEPAPNPKTATSQEF